jgi:hypothetical protein
VGLPSAELVEAGILSAGQFVGSAVPTEQPIQVYIRFRVLNEGARIGTTILLHDDDDHVVLISLSNHDRDWHMRPRPRGTYRSVCELPSNLLAGGPYAVTIGLWEGRYEAGLMEKNALRFTAYEEGFVRGDLPYELRGGSLHPVLSWSSVPDGVE